MNNIFEVKPAIILTKVWIFSLSELFD